MFRFSILFARLLAAMLLCCLFTSASVQAATIAVTNTHDNLAGSLRQAIQDAPAGGTITFNIPTSDAGYNASTGVFAITLTSGELVIAKNLAIDGTGKKIVVQRSGGAMTEFRIFDLTAGTVTLSNLTIASGLPNGGQGGGIRNSGVLTLLGCTLLNNNSSNTEGGGIYNDGSLTAHNCTFSGNDAGFSGHTGESGGAIYNAGTLTLSDSTLAGNLASLGSGIYNAGTAHVRNTIVVGNTDYDSPNDLYGAFLSDGYNLVGDTTNATGFGSVGDQVGATTAQANLGPLQDNGGSTPTMAPQPGSPALDQGNSLLTTDQRGRIRPIDQPGIPNATGGDGSDIGAIEAGIPQTGSTLTVNTTADTNDGTCTLDDCTLPEALDAANGDPNASVITFKAGLGGTIVNTKDDYGFPISSPLTINGPGARVLAISGGGTRRIFDIAPGAGSVTMSGLTLSSGNAAGSSSPGNFGGAILNAATLTLANCTLSGNTAAAFGGAIYNDGNTGNASLTMVNSTLTGNSAASGAGIFCSASNGQTTVNATNCTFNQNTASQYGGAIYNDSNPNGVAALTMTSCTLNQNTAAGGVSGIYNDALDPNTTGTATVTLHNTILRAGASGVNLYNDSNGGGTITSQGHNISSDAAGGDGTTAPGGFLNQPGDERNTDPKLGTLANNGGQTNTVALLTSSPAINTGGTGAPTTDQRGYGRSGTPDIGAYELNGIAPTLAIVVQPALFAETAGTHAATGIVARSGSKTDALTVNLLSTNPARVGVPASVVIPAGASSASFFISAINNSIADGPAKIAIAASASGLTSAAFAILLTDDEARIGLSVAPTTFSETAGIHAAIGTLTRNTPTTAAMAIALASGNKHKVGVPPVVVIPAGKTSVTFFLSAVDNSVADGPQSVKIAAHSKTYPTVSSVVTVLDNEAKLTISVSPGTFSEGAAPGTVMVTITRNTPTTSLLSVLLHSSDVTQVKLPSSVTIPVGASSVQFPLSIVNDRQPEPTKSVTLTASATPYGYAPGSVTVTVTDDD